MLLNKQLQKYKKKVRCHHLYALTFLITILYFCNRLSIMEVVEIIGAVIGLIYLLLEYKANAWLWPVGILMSLFYVVIFFNGKFYADAAVNLYYIGANIYGLALWRRHRHRDKTEIVAELPITHVPSTTIIYIAAISLLLWGALFVLLEYLTDSPVPLGDSFTTALSIVAMWLLAKKFLEQWLFWIVVDVVSAVLYVWKGLYPTAILYAVYTLVAVLGYFQWKKNMLTDVSKENGE